MNESDMISRTAAKELLQSLCEKYGCKLLDIEEICEVLDGMVNNIEENNMENIKCHR